MELEQMREERKNLTDKARSIVDGADSEKREMNKDEARSWEDIMAQVEALTTRIEREERLRAAETQTTRSRQEPTKPEVGEEENRQAQGQPARFRSFGEQMQAILKASRPGGYVDPRLNTRAVYGMSEGSPSDGGFLVQTDFAQELLKRAYSAGQVASRCRRLSVGTNSNSLKINAISETARADGSRWGGVRAYWTAEAGDKTPTLPQFRQIEFNLKKLTGLAYATDELLQDTAALESVLMQAFSEEFAFKLDDAIIRGTGSGMPMGVLASPALVTVSKEVGQLADTFVVENAVKMWSRMWAPSRLNAVWFINQDVEPQLYTMSLAVGTGGMPVYMPAGGLSGQPYGSLFGRPVVAIEQADTVGDLGDVILADMNQYILVDKGGMQSAVSAHVRFTNDETVFRFVYRVDGQPWWVSSLTPFSSSLTQSPFVVLEAR